MALLRLLTNPPILVGSVRLEQAYTRGLTHNPHRTASAHRRV
ncbi:hypothetical protein ACIGG6_17750 [Vreelandella lionensis]|uniref:Uncharacterized protein n=1 Tax=Vreelandella lionensis TaxID=1144478 RepID=A0ABW8BX80_9GAMM